MDDVVRWERDGDVATLTFNRPDRLNGWTSAMEVRYFDLLQQAADDPDVRAVVVTGAGRGFCPGADLDLLDGPGRAAVVASVSAGARPKTFATTVPKIVIAAVNGACAGVGLAQALCCDVRFAAAGAKWTTAFARRGLAAEYATAWLLPRLVGAGRALDLLVSGRVFTSEEALAYGLVTAVVPAADVLATAQAYARDLAANCSPASMAAIKQQVYAASQSSLDDALVLANRLMVTSLDGPDFAEGAQSYLERRPAAFSPLGQGTTFR